MGSAATRIERPPTVVRRQLLGPRLGALLRLCRASGQLAYTRAITLTDTLGRLVTLLGNYDSLSSAELVWLTGSDKAQVSRAVKALEEAGLIERPTLRASIVLTPAGRETFDTIVTLARDRDAALTRGIGKRELKRFAATTAGLTARAAQLLVLERQRSVDAGDADPQPAPEAARADAMRRRDETDRPLSHMTLPALMTLVSYLQRAATIVYKRETGISQFEWQVLAQIVEEAPIALAELIARTGRDKSHIGRTLKRLVEIGAVSQQRGAGRRATILQPSDAGMRIYEAMCALGIDRERMLFEALPDGTREAYLATIDRLATNADAMLRDERSRAGR